MLCHYVQCEQRIRQHKLLKVFYFNGGTLALGMRGSSLQLTKTPSVLSIRNINDDLGMLSDSPTVPWRTYLGPSVKYKMKFLLISKMNFCLLDALIASALRASTHFNKPNQTERISQVKSHAKKFASRNPWWVPRYSQLLGSHCPLEFP